MRTLFPATATWLVLASGPVAAGGPPTAKLLAGELRDAEARQQAELRERLRELQDVARTIERLSDEQERVIRRLQARIGALRHPGDGG